MLKPSHPLSITTVTFHAIIWAILALGIASPTLAQTDYGKITIVLDQPAKDVEIKLVSEHGNVRKCQTDEEGSCVFSALASGNYEVRRSEVTVTVVTLMSGQSLMLEVPLAVPPPPPGPETPKLKAKPLPMPTVVEIQELERSIPGRKGERVTSRQMEELPNRNQTEAPLFEQQPGAVSTGTDSFAGFIFNGQPGSQNVLRENGLNSNPIVRSSASFQDTNALIIDAKARQSIKAYKSFALDTSNTPASFGTGTGGQFVKDVSSGGSKFSGEVYEYFSNDFFGARNFFDFDRKPSLRFNLFGFSIGGQLNDKLFGFFNYEGLRASSGNTLFAAAPKLSLISEADPAVAGLLNSFRAAGASVFAGASPDSDFDILQLEAKNFAQRNGVTTRFDYKLNDADKLSFIYLGSRSRENIPDGASGRRNVSVDGSHKGVFNYERVLTTDAGGNAKLNNQFIFGLTSTPAHLFARSENNVGPDLFSSAVSIGGKITPIGVPGQPGPLAVATSGGLLSGDFSGRHLRLTPRQFSFIDQMAWTGKRHTFTFGGEVRLIRTKLDQLFGTTYTFPTLADFLANRAEVVHSADLGSFTSNTGARNVAQEFYIAYLQDAWKVGPGFLLTWGLRYEYYTPLRETSRTVVHVDPDTGALLPGSNDLFKSRKTNFLPRVAFAWSPNWDGKPMELVYGPRVLSGSFGMHVGPDVFDNILRPITNDRLIVNGGSQAFPVNPAAMISARNAEDARFKPLALSRDYTSPARVYKFDFTFKRELIAHYPFKADDKDVLQEMFFTLSYVGSRGRGLLLRNFANRIVSIETNPDPSQGAEIKREFDIDRGGETLHPYGEFEFLTTGGRSAYDSFQASLKGRLKKHLQLFQLNYTLARNRGNTNGDDAIAAGNPFNYDYDFGYNAADVRHEFKFTTVLSLPCAIPWACKPQRNRLLREAIGNWSLASIGSFQTGTPIDIRLARPDVVYIDQAGNVFSKPAPGRTAVLNTPGGGSSVAAYRPNLVPGVNPYLNDDRNFLNPKAFSIPAPGLLGNLTRGALRGPGVRFVDLSLRKEIVFNKESTSRILTFNWDITNLFNFTNFKLPASNLPDMLGSDNASHQLQPNQPFTAEAAPTFGVMTRTFKRKPDLGASRQMQFGLSLKF